MDGEVREALEKDVIYDRRVVTYKWLTWKFDLHPNTAKDHLRQFINEQEAENSNVAGHSIVTGVKDKVYRVILTSNKRIAKTKKCLTSVIGVHAYSAEPANLEDVETKLSDSSTEKLHVRTSPIHCEAASNARTRNKLPSVTTSAIKYAVQAKSANQCVKTIKEEEKTPNATRPSRKDKAEKTGSASKNASAKGKPKQNELATMFSKAATASASSKPTTVHDATPKGTNRKPSPQKDTKSELKYKTSKLKSSPETKKVKVEAPDSPESPVRKKTLAKRKVISDSEDEDPPDNTPTSSEPSQSTGQTSRSNTDQKSGSSEEPITREKTRKRRRVMKSTQQTFRDEDGYLVTKLVKQVVSESDEEDEEDPIPKAVKGQAKHGGAAKKPAAQGEKKQQSLLSFFGKK